MASEIQWDFVTGRSGYALLRSSSGTIFNRVGGAFESYTAGNYLEYQLSGREQSSGGCYTADFPAAITTPGYYNVEARDQIGGSGVQSDEPVMKGNLWWNGAAVGIQAGVLSGSLQVSGLFIQSGLATAVQVSGIATGNAFVSGVLIQSGIATAVQVSGLATLASVSGLRSFIEGFLPVRLKKNVAFNNFPFLMVSSGTRLPATGLTISGMAMLDGAAFADLTNSASEVSDGWYKINLAAADLNADSVGLKFVAAGASQRDITIVTQASGG